jgi:hypothetical protein
MIAKLFQPKPNLVYPQMRDPKRSPKCYELTDQEREEAVRRLEQKVKEEELESSYRYYGA